MKLFAAFAAFAALALWLAPGLAVACAVCSGGQDQSRTAFIATTVLLSVLPLGFIGCMALWIRSRARALAARERELFVAGPWKHS